MSAKFFAVLTPTLGETSKESVYASAAAGLIASSLIAFLSVIPAVALPKVSRVAA